MAAAEDANNKAKVDDDDDDEWKATSSGYSKQISRLTSLHASDLIDLLDRDIQKATTILDIGCGTGAFALAYLQHYPRGIPGQTLISSDLSPSMLNEAKVAVAAALKKTSPSFQEGGSNDGCETKFVFQEEDGSKLSGIADDSMDMVVSIFGVFLIPAQEATLQAIHRVLKPKSGVFGNAAWTLSKDPMDSTFGGNFQIAFMRTVAAATTDMMTQDNDEDVMDYWKPSDEHPNRKWIDPELIRSRLSQDDMFSDIKILRPFHSVVWPDFESLWSLVVVHPFVNPKSATSEQWANMKRVLLESIKTDGDTSTAFVVWTVSNLSIARIGSHDTA